MSWVTRFVAWRLTAPDRTLLIAGSTIALGLTGHFLVLAPVKEEMHRLDAAITKKQEDQRTLVAIRHEYVRVRERLRLAEGRLVREKERASILALGEELTRRLQLRERIAFLRPQAGAVGEGFRESSAELKLEGLRLNEVLSLMTAIDDSPYLLRVRRFHLKTRFSDPSLFDLTLLLTTYESVPHAAQASGGAERGG